MESVKIQECMGKGMIEIIDDPEGGAVCRIGNRCFHFIKDGHNTGADEYMSGHSAAETAELIAHILESRETAGEYGISPEDYDYFVGRLKTDGAEKIKIKYFTDKIDKIDYLNGNSDWIDLRAAEDVTMKAGEYRLIPLGIAMQLPEGYEAHFAPRSSTYKNFGLIQTNHVGVVDESYCGDEDQWYFPAYALRDTQIKTNDRICQFRIMKHQPLITFEETDSLSDKSRGGFGTSGKQ